MFMRLLGPALGYTIASLCLKLYISPDLTPVIDSKDNRWLGAWWLGWLVFAFVLFVFALMASFVPKELPRAAVRRRIEIEKTKRGLKGDELTLQNLEAQIETEASVQDMIVTFKRLFRNKIFMLMNIAGIFHLFG
jgi:solute carrier organic anion transporter family, member 5A